MCTPAIHSIQGVNITRYLETLRISLTKSFKIKIAGEHLPLSSRLRENTLRYQIFDPGGHMIRSEHMKSCLTSQIRFLLFKGLGSFKQNFKIGGNIDELKACRLIPLTPPIFFHFTLPLSPQSCRYSAMINYPYIVWDCSVQNTHNYCLIACDC